MDEGLFLMARLLELCIPWIVSLTAIVIVASVLVVIVVVDCIIIIIIIIISSSSSKSSSSSSSSSNINNSSNSCSSTVLVLHPLQRALPCKRQVWMFACAELNFSPYSFFTICIC